MQIDALAVRLRPRTPMEAADLGVRLSQSTLRAVYTCHLFVSGPLVVLALASIEIAGWLPTTLIWCSKPWLDRTILFVLSRAAFNQPTRVLDLWRAQRQVWWSQFPFDWTIRRLSPWRSLTQPVYQLEGMSIWRARGRVRQIRQRVVGSAFLMTQAFALSEIALMISVLSLFVWFAPAGRAPDIGVLLSGEGDGILSLALPISYAVVVMFLEPFYVAAGFGMYLNRRAELEAWDIEQDFRRAFAH